MIFGDDADTRIPAQDRVFIFGVWVDGIGFFVILHRFRVPLIGIEVGTVLVGVQRGAALAFVNDARIVQAIIFVRQTIGNIFCLFCCFGRRLSKLVGQGQQ